MHRGTVRRSSTRGREGMARGTAVAEPSCHHSRRSTIQAYPLYPPISFQSTPCPRSQKKRPPTTPTKPPTGPLPSPYVGGALPRAILCCSQEQKSSPQCFPEVQVHLCNNSVGVYHGLFCRECQVVRAGWSCRRLLTSL